VGLDEQKRFEDSELRNVGCLVASPDGRAKSLTIHQDANIFLSRLDNGATLNVELVKGRYAWLQVLRGSVTLNGEAMTSGDDAAIEEELKLEVSASSQSEMMLFDLT